MELAQRAHRPVDRDGHTGPARAADATRSATSSELVGVYQSVGSRLTVTSDGRRPAARPRVNRGLGRRPGAGPAAPRCRASASCCGWQRSATTCRPRSWSRPATGATSTSTSGLGCTAASGDQKIQIRNRMKPAPALNSMAITARRAAGAGSSASPGCRVSRCGGPRLHRLRSQPAHRRHHRRHHGWAALAGELGRLDDDGRRLAAGVEQRAEVADELTATTARRRTAGNRRAAAGRRRR